MRMIAALAAFGALAACGDQSSGATFTCPRGPDLTVTYAAEGATLYFPDGRVELLPQPDPEKPNLYARPGFSFVVGARTARLDDGSNSYLCDQMAG